MRMFNKIKLLQKLCCTISIMKSMQRNKINNNAKQATMHFPGDSGLGFFLLDCAFPGVPAHGRKISSNVKMLNRYSE